MTTPAVSPTNPAAAASMIGFAQDARRLSSLPDAEAVKAAAGQFESILVRQFLQESVGNILGSGPSGNVYGYMLTDLLAAKITEGGGLGLSSVLQQQLTPRAHANADAARETLQ